VPVSAGPAEDIRRFEAEREDRLDRLVATALPELSRTRARRLFEEGAVRVGGQLVERASHMAVAGDAIEVTLPPPDVALGAAAILASTEPLVVLYEDEHTLVIDKAAGIVVHPAPGLDELTLIEVVRALYPEVRDIDDSDRPGVVHRLDRDTSGVMVFAKSAAAQHMLKEQWRERESTKVYLALVEGVVEPPAGIIEAPLGPDATRPGRRAVIEGGQSARSEYRVLEQYGTQAALIEVRIYTGRTHQSRVHMQAGGHPVVGDTLYGRWSELFGRQALHAGYLGFTLASTGERREFEAAVPADLEAAIAALRSAHSVPSKSLAPSLARGGQR
jgi:23S rRNA pseudouridine1911/1915/1917 synthase